MNALEFRNLVGNNIFTVSFTKKDGSNRVMNARLGVTKHLRGGEDSTAHIAKYVNVYDLKSEGYRKVNLESVTELKCNGEVIKF